MNINREIQKQYNAANKLAIKEVEKLARIVLSKNPKQVKSFMMAMGSYFFMDNNDDIIFDSHGNNKKRLQRLSGYNKLISFIDKWDDIFHLTGEGMTFTAKGKKITN